MPGNGIKRAYRFGPFWFDAETGELRRQGTRLALQPKAQQLLLILLENAGEVITREDLHRRLWDGNTFVDFESGLNTTANRLRAKLNDSASQPRYIETLPRVGYRFIGPVDHGESSGVVAAAPPERPVTRSRRVWLAAALLLAIAAAVAVLWRPRHVQPATPQVRFRALTFRRGQVLGARFTPDGRNVLYSAEWESTPRQLFLASMRGPESRVLGFEGYSLASVSSHAELALYSFGGTMNIGGGALYRVPMTGSAPAFAAQGVMSADWTPDGAALVIIRAANGGNQLEVPAGRVVYRTGGWLSSVRADPEGGRVAFVEHPFRHDESGRVLVFENGRGVRALSEGWVTVAGLAWSPNRREVWFTAARDDRPRSLWAVSLEGRLRALAQAPGVLTLRDIAPDGRVLVTRDTRRLEMVGGGHGIPEQYFSWLDWSRVQELSSDGRFLLFDESGEASGNRSVTYLRDLRTRSVTRLSEGMAMGLAPGGDAALIAREDRERLALVPLRGGAPRWLPATGLRYQWARFFPTGGRLLALAGRPGEPLRLYVQPLDGAAPAPISPETMIRNAAISPDGAWVAALSPTDELLLYPVQANAEPRRIATHERLAPLRWMSDGRRLIVQHLRRVSDSSAQLSLVDVASGRVEPWMRLQPADPIGVNSITGVALSANGESYVYSYRRVLSELYEVEGWR